MGRVRVLPPNLVNKIAAGECVERPASVVKELVENSLDAGATRIDIAVQSGGKSLIRVADDGGGMDGDDLATAVQPHATSKLADESDLFALHTMGFRGEALPSIGSVSQMRIVTRPRGSDQAFAIDLSGGEIGQVVPAAAAFGTIVEVRNLFFNTPARRKFLKADSTEISHITEALARIALSFTEVQFRLTHNGRLVYDLPPSPDLGRRITDFFGSELGGALIPVEQRPADEQAPGIRGLIGLPQNSRASAKWQYIFLNGRYIRDRYIQHALREAYRGLMEPSRQPVVFLYLLLAPELVDFNVHPTKIEVRFADSNRIHSAVLRCLRDRLTRTDLTHSGGEQVSGAGGQQIEDSVPPDLRPPIPDPCLEEDEQARQERIRSAVAEFFRKSEPTQRRMVFEPATPLRNAELGMRNEESGVVTERGAAAGPSAPTPLFDRSRERVKPGLGPSSEGEPVLAPPDRSMDIGTGAGAGASPIPNSEFRTPNSPSPVLQVHNTYLVCQTDDGLVIIDQHALHERIIYESLLARMAGATPSADGGEGGEPPNALQAQRMLIPQRVTLGARQAGLLFEHEELLARLGVELTRFGRDEVAICAFPSLLERADPAAFIRDLADRLADEPPETPEAFLHEVLDMMACKAAVKAGDPLSSSEIDTLLAQRHLVERASNCPHGRPTAIRFSLAELEKQFKRR